MLNNAELLARCFTRPQRANVERVAALLAERPTLTSPQIADMTGIPERTVQRHRRTLKLNVPRGGASHGDAPVRKPAVRKPRPPKARVGWDSRDVEAMLARAREGVFAADLAEEFHCHLSTISRLCHAHGVPMAKAPHGPGKGGEENRARVLAYLTENPQASTKEIMQELHLGMTAVQRHRVALGLSIPHVGPTKDAKPKSAGRHFLCQTKNCELEFPFNDPHPWCGNGSLCTVRLVR